MSPSIHRAVMTPIVALRCTDKLRRTNGVFRDLLRCLQPSAEPKDSAQSELRALTLRSATHGPRTYSTEVERGQALLTDWEQRRPEAFQSASEEDTRSVLRAAVGLQRSRAPQVTDQLQQLVMKLYVQGSLGPGEGRENFLRVICQDFGVQADGVDAAMKNYKASQDRSEFGEEAVLRSLEKLQQACQPAYASLFVPISNQPGGIRFLSALRSDVLQAARNNRGRDLAPQLRALSNAIRNSLAAWFSAGLLDLRRISWEASPAALLEKVMQYEQVHEFDREQPWEDLKARLSEHRRLFGFFHGSMPDEPLVLLHTALMPDITAKLGDILEPTGTLCAPEDAAAAVFYSISSTQAGLAGIDLGTFLIKHVAGQLLRDFPGLQHLSTLSPLPGFSKWLAVAVNQHFRGGHSTGGALGLDDSEAAALSELWRLACDQGQEPDSQYTEHLTRSIMTAVFGQSRDEDEQLWQPFLLRQAAQYLLLERRRGLALDPVANFHLRNGAEIWRINWKAFDSPDSFGIMVNYKYDLASITNNNQAYIHSGKVAAADQVRALLSRQGCHDSA